MKRHRVSSAAAALVVCAAATACGSATATTTAAAAAARPAPKVVVFGCVHHAEVRPGSFILTCADDGSFLSGLSWSSWTAGQATATGVHQLNDCTPNCAGGKFRGYPVTVTFWRSELAAGHPGERYFTMITVRYTGPRPPAYMSDGTLVKHPAAWNQPLGSIG